MDDLALLVLRVVVGSLFVGHGTAKLLGWFAGGGVSATADYFASLGYPRARTMAVLAGLTEVAAGAALATGLLTPLAAAALIGVMVNAGLAGHGDAGLWSENDGYEYPLVLAVIAGAVALSGPGAHSLDDALGLDLAGGAWAAGAVAVGVVSALVLLGTRRTSPDRVGAELP